MKKSVLTTLLLFSFLIIACESKEDKKIDQSQLAPGARQVVVEEVLDVASYNYVKVDDYGDKYWIAIPKQELKVGGTYYFKDFMEMKDFKSEELDRTFESVLFVQELTTEPILKEESPHGAMPPGSKSSVTNKANITVEKPAGGKSIAEVFENKNELVGKDVTVKGKVMKFNAQIMGRNWVHIQDGSEFDGKYDLTFTTDDVFEIGTIVTVKGVVAVDQDFGFGYTYDLLLENAKKISLDSH